MNGTVVLKDWKVIEIAHIKLRNLPGERGHPSFTIQRDQILYLLSLGFSWTNIASLLSVSLYDSLSQKSRVQFAY